MVKGWWMPAEEQHLTDHPWREDQGYQWRQRQRAIELASEGWAIDVGAHVGLWARDFCRSPKFTRVQCWEPMQQHRQCLERNVQSEKLEILAAALSNTPGQCYMQWQGSNTGNTQISQRETEYLVEKTTLDLQTYRHQIGLIKIDVEGWEHLVIEGADRTIRDHRPTIVIEQKPHQGRENQYLARDLLVTMGYKTVERWGDDWIMQHAG